MRKLGSILLMILLVTLMGTVVYGASSKTEKVIINGKEVQLQTKQSNNRTYYPLRAICDELGISIDSVESGAITLSKSGSKVCIKRGEGLIVWQQGEKGYAYYSEFVTIEEDGVTYLPVRTLAFLFGYDLKFADKQLVITEETNYKIPSGTAFDSDILYDYLLINSDLEEEFNKAIEKGSNAKSDKDFRNLIGVFEKTITNIDAITNQLKTDEARQVSIKIASYLLTLKQGLQKVIAGDIKGYDEKGKELDRKEKEVTDAIEKFDKFMKDNIVNIK